MGVYIPNMEMPTKCETCIIARLSETGESLRCGYTFDVVPWGDVKPPFDCPLVPVPPHGRLIDDMDIDFVMFEKKMADEFDSVFITTLEKVNAAPTIIEAEEGE